MNVLFPEDYFRKGKPDALYLEQFEAFQACGFQCVTLNLEQLADANAKLRSLMDGNVLYRGWMLNEEEYQALTRLIERSGQKPVTSLTQYLSAHHLPRWYEVLIDLTPETAIFQKDVDFNTELEKLNWGQYFIKDYVKSLKTGAGSFVDSAERAEEVVANMMQFRGVIEGGICVRRAETFVQNSEIRYFVIDGQIHGPQECDSIPEIVQECARRIRIPFFSVDCAKLVDGNDRIVEIGDGQVSDLVGWSAERLAGVLNQHWL